MSENQQESLEGLEARVRKVQHLDPFSLVRHPDGRFSAKLERPVGDLEPETARTILEELEPILRKLRDRAPG